LSDKDDDFWGTLIIRGVGLVVIIGLIWGWDSFDKVLDIFGIDATEKRQTELLLTLSETQKYQNPIRINDNKNFKGKITSFTEIQEENYEAEMENSIWEVTGEVYDVEKDEVYAGLNKYEIDIKLRSDDFLSTNVIGYCFAKNENEKNMIENLSPKTMITIKGKFKNVSSSLGGYLYLKDCIITKVGSKQISKKKLKNRKVLASLQMITKK
jgi:hypothetical protein